MDAGIMDFLGGGMKGMGGGRSSAGANEMAMDADEMKKKKAWGGASDSLMQGAANSAPQVGQAPAPMGLAQMQMQSPQFQNVMEQDPRMEALKRLGRT
jgi:hypothetical protein